jgi:cobalt-zinc-cadmium efflux system membrane fusion protein
VTDESRVTLRRSAAAVAAIALLLAGAGTTYVLMRSGADPVNRVANPAAERDTPSTPTPITQPPAAEDTSSTPLPDIIVSLSKEAIDRAGIAAAPVSSGTSSAELRLPGIVAPNAYREVVVTPLVAGRLTRVSAELGDRVRRGQNMAQIYSPELAEAQARYISTRAQLDAHDRELQRTQKLVEIGAASRQELERIHAEHAAQTAEVRSARSRLELLGVRPTVLDDLTPGQDASATTNVPAPIDGVVTERGANVGLNVDRATKLFTVVDLSTVWVVADVYEGDFSRVHVGDETRVIMPAYPESIHRGQVSYISPQVSAETRTAKVRVEVPNPRGELRLGMYADVVITGRAGAVPMIARSAVQHVGDRTVVYVVHPEEPGKFTEREVRLGRSTGEQVAVVSGLHVGDVVVTTGSFFVRAERERLGLRPLGTTAPPATREPAPAGGAASLKGVQTAEIVVNEQGYAPGKITLRAGAPARITFVRTTEKTCGTEVVFPSLKIRRPLPLNEPVFIEFTPAAAGQIVFVCGMKMLGGAIVVQ